ncbi:MAG: NHL repeat-containing protein [SAR324 cluster bacterium]|nr:NHL repeat-containing protein [SAR324 cluster bacterium]
MLWSKRNFLRKWQSLGLFLFLFSLLFSGPHTGNALPLKSTILDPQNKPLGLAHIYIDYVELLELDGTLRGKVSFVKTRSGFEVFVVRVDGKNSWVGRASNRKLYDTDSSFDNYTVSTLAGSGTSGSSNGQGEAAGFNRPTGVVVDSSGSVFVVDNHNHVIRRIDSSGNVTTLAGTAGRAGFTDAQGTEARFNKPSSAAVDSLGNIYVADIDNHLIRKIDSSGNVTTLAGTAGSSGSENGKGIEARFNKPSGVAVDSSGNVYVADRSNHLIRRIDLSGNVTTLAGKAGSAGSTNGQGTSATFNQPSDVAVDSSGSVYVVDLDNHLIRKIDSSGNVTTLAGKVGSAGSTNGQGTSATFNQPTGLAVDSSGSVYVADYNNHLIRRIDSSGNVITLAGSGSAGFADGQGSAAKFNFPTGVAADSSGNVYVADFDNHRIRKLSGKAKLLAYYDWSSFWSYVYNEEGKLLGKLKCLAFRGICAAGAASFLTGMLEGD